MREDNIMTAEEALAIVKHKLDHLPIKKRLSEIVSNFRSADNTMVVTSEVASGKTLLIPFSCAVDIRDTIYVLEPTRLLANNAAENLIAILGDDNQNNFVGCLNSNRHEDASYTHDENLVVFTTVGYALASGIISDARNIIFDEAHEKSIDMSLARALIHKRITGGDSVRVGVLSATLDVETENSYWGDRMQHLHVEGANHPVSFIHSPGLPLADAVQHLIDNCGHRGILVFVEGKEEIESASEQIRYHFSEYFPTDGSQGDMEILHISGNSTYQERMAAMSKMSTPIRVLIGTNVMESGISFEWVDAGVSTGQGKILNVTENVHRLDVEDLPSWRILQQTGRVGRFRPGTFIMVGQTKMEDRPRLGKPDITRLPLEELVMHCAKLGNIQLESLHFPVDESPNPERVRVAIHSLQRYELVQLTEDGKVELTDQGRYVRDLPLSYRSLAATCEAIRLGAGNQMIPLIASIEIGDIRHDTRHPLRGITWERSDLLTQVLSISQFMLDSTRLRNNINFDFRDMACDWNLSMKKYREFNRVVKIIERFFSGRADFDIYLTNNPDHRRRLEKACRQVIFRAMIGSRHYCSFGTICRSSIDELGEPSDMVQAFRGMAMLSKQSVCTYNLNHTSRFVTANIRTIRPKDRMPFDVAEMVTLYDDRDIENLKKRWPMEVIDPENRFVPVKSSQSEMRLTRAAAPIVKRDPEDTALGLALKKVLGTV